MKLEGEVGIIGNGAGLVMSTLDVVRRPAGAPANFLDVGGGASAERWRRPWRSSWAIPTCARFREHLRRDHAVRRGRERHPRGARTDRRPGTAGGPARRDERRRGPGDPRRGRPRGILPAATMLEAAEQAVSWRRRGGLMAVLSTTTRRSWSRASPAEGRSTRCATRRTAPRWSPASPRQGGRPERFTKSPTEPNSATHRWSQAWQDRSQTRVPGIRSQALPHAARRSAPRAGTLGVRAFTRGTSRRRERRLSRRSPRPARGRARSCRSPRRGRALRKRALPLVTKTESYVQGRPRPLGDTHQAHQYVVYSLTS